MDLGIAGKTALVLGASRGLGAAIAQGLADEGVHVLAGARTTSTLAGRTNITPVAVDLSDPASVDALIAEVKRRGDIDILVNNSGGPKAGPASGQARTAWLAAFETMATSIFAITDAVLEGMIARQWGRVITVGSSGVVQPIPNLALSNGVRGAIAGWSKTLAAEVARHGITVNMVLPGRIETDRLKELDGLKAKSSGVDLATVQDASRKEIPAGRFGDPAEFAAVAVFLASRQASYVTGSAIRVDGGMIRGH